MTKTVKIRNLAKVIVLNLFIWFSKLALKEKSDAN